MTLTELYVYPVKALRGLSVPRWGVDEFGLKHDRRWMVVGTDGVAVTQRDLPQMALITPRLVGDELHLNAPDMPDQVIETDDNAPSRRVTIWNDTVDAAYCGAPAAEWLSDFLGEEVTLVHMPDRTFRRINQAYSPDQRRVSFADGYPFLLISQESLDELNTRLEQPIEMRRFRPNLVVTGAPEPHAEDTWKQIAIGEIAFDIVKPCERCAVPTIDPETGVRGKEPNTTLATYRRREGKVYFGQNLIHRSNGTLQVGATATAGT